MSQQALRVEGEEEALLPEDALPDEEDEDDEEEEDFDEEDLEDDAQFQRYVRELPLIHTMATASAGSQELEQRLVDFRALEQAESGSEMAASDDEEEEDDEDEEEQSAGKLPEGDKPTPMEVGDDEHVEAEIDGVAFTYKRGARRGGGVHRTLNSLMESIQTVSKQGRKSSGYDLNMPIVDGQPPMIDDGDINEDEEDISGLLEDEQPVAMYSYSDFSLTRDYVEPPKKRAAAGEQQPGKKVKPLKDLLPPATEELKNAIDHFRERAKAVREHDVKRYPAELEEPLLRLGRAVVAWDPKHFMPVHLFEYVTDVIPRTAESLKAKAKALLAKADKDAAGTTAASAAITPLAQSTPAADGSQANAIDLDAPFEDDVEASAGKTLAQRKSDALAKLGAAVDEVIALAGEVERRAFTKVMQQRAEMLANSEAAGEKKTILFQWPDDVLEDLDAVRAMVHSTDGNKGVQHLYSAVVALFPEGLMDNARVGYKLALKRKKMTSAPKGTAASPSVEGATPDAAGARSKKKAKTTE